MSCAVVIPFFQRERGILPRALLSVAAQTDVDDIEVIVVDDESPIPARDEIAAVGPLRFPVRLIEQRNGGPASARNAALESLGADVERVAFLDSDDEWMPQHLSRAFDALRAGFDFYFSDHFQLNQSVSAFARGERLRPTAHDAIGPGLYAYRGDMFDQVVTGNVIGTSTVVLDRGRLGNLRFDVAFLNAGEDYLFWMACARRGARFCFSTEVEVRYCAGVNVYAQSGWGTPGHLKRVHHEMKYRKAIAAAFAIDARQRRLIRRKIALLRAEFAGAVAHRIVARKSLDIAVIKDQIRLDPLTFLSLPIVAGQTMAGRIRGRVTDS